MWTAAAPPEGFVWGYDSRSTTENYEQWVAWSESPTPPPTEEGVPSVGEIVLSWYDSGIRITDEASETPEPTETSPHSTADTADVAEIRAAAELYRLSAAEAVSYLEGETSALLAAGVKPSRIAAALKVVVTAAAKEQEPPAAVDGAAATEKVWPRRGGAPTYHPKRPVRKVAAASAGANSISVAEACTFLAMNPNVSFERKKSFLLSKGVSTFTIAQAACTASNAALVL